MKNTETDTETGTQRLSLDQLQRWEALKFGLFIHFGMSTFTGEELPSGTQPSTQYAPDRLDVDQWVCVARDAGMKYAVLTAKHVAGHCLWPTKLTDYHVGTSGHTADVVEAFVKACEKRGVLPGLYYCSWDNHHRFGSLTPSDYMRLYPDRKFDCVSQLREVYTTREYQDFQSAQLGELLTQYGKIAEVWIDIPGLLPRGCRNDLYRQIAQWQPEAVIMMNHGIGDGSDLRVHYAWPTDLVSIERFLPNSHTGHVKWREVEGRKYYLPGETCDPIGREWFFTEDDAPRSDEELLGMYLAAVSRGTNFLLDVGPDKHGLIHGKFIGALRRLRSNLDKLGL
ncbi:MAG: alpha-L-fucosidase [Terrimicrobiaceae bacterium]